MITLYQKVWIEKICNVMSRNVMSSHAMSCQILSHHLMSCYIILKRVILYHVLLCYVILYYIMSSNATSLVMSRHVMLI